MEFATSGRTDSVSAWYTGYIEAPEEGVYTFYLLSDDASDLYIGSEKVVENYGEHWCHMRERAGQIGLKAGRHSLSIVNVILGILEPTPHQFWAADYNSDGCINILDVIGIIKVILGHC